MNVLTVKKSLMGMKCCRCDTELKVGKTETFFLLEIIAVSDKVERILCSTKCLHAEVLDKSVDDTIAGIYINKYK